MLLIVMLTRGDTSYNVINREDPCINLCEKTPATLVNVCVPFLQHRILHYIFIYLDNGFILEHLCEVLLPTRL